MPETQAWSETPSVIQLPTQGQVHIWRYSLKKGESEVAQMRSLLNEEERARADRFYFERDRHHFTLARGMLRYLLGKYVDCPAEHIPFTYGEQGKPFLDWEKLGDRAKNHAENLQFNVSHSGELALYAITHEQSVGVDIEQVRELDHLALAKRYFAEGEWQEIERSPSHLQQKLFFDCWTRKEAYIKAFGKGLSIPLDGFEVSLDSQPSLKSTDWQPENASRWSMENIELGDQYSGALVVAGDVEAITYWQL